VFSDQLICEDFGCVQTTASPSLDGDPSFAAVPLTIQNWVTSGLPGGRPLFRGGVLMLDGRVLLTPSMSSRFVIVDVQSMTATGAGGTYSVSAGEPLFGAAVLGCDGAVYALPDHYPAIVRIRPAPPPSTVLDFEELTVDAGGISGAVVSDVCDYAVHIAAAAPGVRYDLSIFPDGGVQTRTTPLPYDSSDAGRQGLARSFDDGYWLMAAPQLDGGDPTFCDVAAIGTTTFVEACQPASVEVSGGVVAPTSGDMVVFNNASHWIQALGPSALCDGAQVELGPMKWPLARGDGYIYGASDRLIAVREDMTAGPILLFSWSDGGEGPKLNGLVNTWSGPSGAIVGVPGIDPVVWVFVADAGMPPPVPQLLLSPFLNKL
jgi:hypothetical protein